MSGFFSKAEQLWLRLSYSNMIDPKIPSGWFEFHDRLTTHMNGKEIDLKEHAESHYRILIEKHFKNLRHKKELPPTWLDLSLKNTILMDLARSTGFLTVGVDPSEKYCLSAFAKTHQVEQVDPLFYLRGLENDTVSGISMLRLLDCNSWIDGWKLFKESHRVLVQGGLLLAEYSCLLGGKKTNIEDFFRDPSREKPIHQDYLKFLCADLGFYDLYFSESVIGSKTTPQQTVYWMHCKKL